MVLSGTAAVWYHNDVMKLDNVPISIGIASARANLLPMCVLWFMAVSLAVAYYFVPGMAETLEPVRQWQEANGVLALTLNLG